MTKIPLVIIVGPTAVGKTALSIEVAKRISGEIISGDAIQVYRGMDVGSAKITPEETEGVPHHLIDILSPDESYSAAAFKNMAEDLIRDIHARGHIPMIVGGTGLYIQSVIYEYGFSDENPAETKNTRNSLNNCLQRSAILYWNKPILLPLLTYIRTISSAFFVRWSIIMYTVSPSPSNQKVLSCQSDMM